MEAGEPEAAYRHCAALVRANDPDRATAALFADADRQDDLMALAAFDLETTAIPSLVSQPMPGEIRLQWWRDLLETRSGASGSPVAEALLATVRRRALPSDLLDRLLDARIFDLYDDPFETVADLEAYAGETHSTLLSLGARALGSPGRGPVADVAGHGGIALAVLEILRLAGRAPQRAGKFVPAAMLRSVGAERAEWPAAPGGRSGVTDLLAAFARDHLGKALAGLPQVERAVRPAFLPLVTLGRELAAARARLEGRQMTAPGPLVRSFSYWRAMRRKG